MQSKLKLDHQTKAVAMATGGAAIAAIFAMFVPTGIWETLTGSTGVSEMIPATAAPLGDTARALISFLFGALTFAILTVLLLRKAVAPVRTAIAQPEPETVWIEPETVEADVVEAGADAEAAESVSLLSRLRSRIAAFAEARRGAGDITDLEDLPKLRSGDAHPDAPPRRPFSANRDLAEPEVVEAPAETVVEQVEVDAEWAEPVAAEIEEVAEAIEIIPANEGPAEAIVEAEAIESVPAETPVDAPVTEIASLDDMVSRFESALAERDAQLAHIESVASALQASNVQPIRPDIEAPTAIEAVPVEQAPLRAVEAAASEPEDVPQKPESEELDAALRSALETLHRMNARTR
ncbi:MAG: hypothetical protein IPG54_12575 [Sphingomonadales bacterium]|jgi:hypothetical protein|nr:hypothetical protein [Sphingomonadales bacterium]MBK9004518.1 hypothetical protein [Sphingomonadales bacterium]MBK9269705.1 hypothetical protein [Sphingomonadales bacterium]MBP6433354.1 hypothetical protein [Sphingorhabdus sp.]